MTRKRIAVVSLLAIVTVLFEETGRPVRRATAAEFGASCSVNALKQAITDANNSAGPDVVSLAQGCVYTLTTVDNSEFGGDNGLPQITGDLTIEGNDATIERSATGGTPDFRILRADGASLTLRNLTVRNGRLEGSDFVLGAGVRSNTDLIIENSIVSGNQIAGVGVIADARGAGSFSSGTTTITNSLFLSNSAEAVSSAFGGGAFAFGGLIIVGSRFDSNAISAPSALGGGVGTAGSADITSSTFTMNTSTSSNAASAAGAHSQLAMNVLSSTFSNNTAIGNGLGAFGGGIRSDADLTLKTSRVLDNIASGKDGAQGGGTWAAGSTTIERSTVARNSAIATQGPGEGGGVYAFGALNGTNATISGNSVSGTGATLGGGSFSRLSTTVTNATYTANVGPGVEGGGIYSNTTIDLANTISGDNTGGDCAAFSTITANASNLDRDGTCGLAATVADLKLAPLALNGPGSTETHALAADSPALGIGMSCPAVDQRGVPRTVVNCDAGAYELSPGLLLYDVECDSDEDVVDALAVMNVVAGIGTAPQPGGACDADVDNDADVDLSDVIVVRRGVAGL